VILLACISLLVTIEPVSSQFRASKSVVSVCIAAVEERYFFINAITAAGSLATTATLLP